MDSRGGVIGMISIVGEGVGEGKAALGRTVVLIE